jgi:ABC-2 type transport system permease protein
MKQILLYLAFAKMSVRSELAHRGSFIAGIIGQWLSYGATFFSVYVMVSAFDTLAGWSAPQVVFLYAFNLLSYALGAMFFFNPSTRLDVKIRTGEFDSALTKPVSPLAHELYLGFNCAYVSHISLSLVMLCLSAPAAGVSFSAGGVLLFSVMLVSAAMIQGALLLLSSVMGFFTVGDNPIIDVLFWEIKRFTNYPITIYHVIIQIFLTFVLPFAFMNFYPVSAVLHKEDEISIWSGLPYVTPIVAGLVLFVSVKIWNWGLSKYQSTGS